MQGDGVSGSQRFAGGKRRKGEREISPCPLFPFSSLLLPPLSAPRKLSAIFRCPTIVIRIASCGHACTHAGASPTARRSWHRSHLRTMPCLAENFGTSYGHFKT